MKKLGLTDSPKLDHAVENIIEKVGKSNRNKYRAIVYYELVKEFGQEGNTINLNKKETRKLRVFLYHFLNFMLELF